MSKSSRPLVFLTREIISAGTDLLRSKCSVRVQPHDRPIRREELIENVGNCHALLSMLTDKIDTDVMKAAPKLQIIANYAVGYDNIDIREAEKRGIIVTNTPGVLTETTAETAFALMMATARRLMEASSSLRSGVFSGWGPTAFLGQDLFRKTLGIAGFGRIGRAVARRAAAGFHMRVLCHDVKRDASAESEFGAEYVTKEELFSRSDIISIHLPLTDESRHYVGERELRLMKQTACLINTARGPVIDEKALIAALRDRTIFAAGLDVYEHEPIIPRELLDLDNAILLPHIGSASVDTRTRMAIMAAENIVAHFSGAEPRNRIV